MHHMIKRCPQITPTATPARGHAERMVPAIEPPQLEEAKTSGRSPRNCKVLPSRSVVGDDGREPHGGYK